MNKEASVMIKNGHITSGMDKTGPEEKAALRVSNARCWRLVLPGEQIEGSNNIGEVGNKIAIEICKPKEKVNTLDGGWRFPFFDSRKFNQVHFDLSLSNYHAKEFYSWYIEGALGEFEG